MTTLGYRNNKNEPPSQIFNIVFAEWTVVVAAGFFSSRQSKKIYIILIKQLSVAVCLCPCPKKKLFAMSSDTVTHFSPSPSPHTTNFLSLSFSSPLNF